MTRFELLVPQQSAGTRLDAFVSASLEEVSRAQAQTLISEGNVTVNGAAVSKSRSVNVNDLVVVNLPEPQVLEAVAQDIPLDIVYEDDDLLVVNKPKGMVVHPAPGNPDGTLVNALLWHCAGRLSSINGVIRPGIVHRIDKDTSGLLLVAKNDRTHVALAEMIKTHDFYREYRAVVTGHMKSPTGVIDLPIGRSPSDRKKQAVCGLNPREALTRYEVLRSFPRFDECRFVLETGRTHQIRVHAAAVGHPVAGDVVYGGEKNAFGLQGQCLHAMKLGFRHPATGEDMMFEAPLPDYFLRFLDKINV